jgi:RHS repeat-associated protein
MMSGRRRNGNLTKDELGQQYVYDAWNRLVTVKDSTGATIAAYTYDGVGRRITETSSGTTTKLYFSAAGQVLEEQVGSATQARNVWSPVYVNALVLRDQSSAHNGTLDQRLYVMQDANWNVTGLVDRSGNVVERYIYSPYGVATAWAPDWGGPPTTDYGMPYLFQGGRYDGATGNYIFNARDYRPTTGQWLQRDPLGLAAGDLNIGRMERNNTTNAVDPSGLDLVYTGRYSVVPDTRISAEEAAAMDAWIGKMLKAALYGANDGAAIMWNDISFGWLFPDHAARARRELGSTTAGIVDGCAMVATACAGAATAVQATKAATAVQIGRIPVTVHRLM